jgi:hypothetical protein
MSDGEDAYSEEEQEDTVLARGHRRAGSNTIIEDFYNPKFSAYDKAYIPTMSLEMGIGYEGDLDKCLNSHEMLTLFTAFNSFGKNEKGTSCYKKNLMSEVPESFMRYIAQKGGSLEHDKSYLMIAHACKRTAKGTGQHPISIITIFGVEQNGAIISPLGLTYSEREITHEDQMPFNLKSIYKLESDTSPVVKELKEIANRIDKGNKMTQREHYTVFCFIQHLHASNTKFSRTVFEMALFVNTKGKNSQLNDCHYVLTGGTYNDEKINRIKLSFKQLDGFDIDKGVLENDVLKFHEQYHKVFELKKTRASAGKRKRGRTEPDSAANDSIRQLNPDKKFLNIEIKNDEVIKFDSNMMVFYNQKAGQAIPKTEDEFWLYAKQTASIEDDDLKQKIDKFNAYRDAQTQKGKTLQEAVDLMILEAVSELKLKEGIRIVISGDNADGTTTHPVEGWIKGNENIVKATKKIVVDMCYAAMVLTVQDTQVTSEKLSELELEQRLTGFFESPNPDRIIGDKITCLSLQNTLKLENAMETVVDKVLRNRWGKDVAIQIAVLARHMVGLGDVIIEKEYQKVCEWMATILDFDIEDDITDFHLYHLPSVISAMLLYFTRSITIIVDERGWIDSTTIKPNTAWKKWSPPMKINDLASLFTKWGTFEDVLANKTISDTFETSQVKASLTSDLHNAMITSRSNHVSVPSKSMDKPVMLIRVNKIVDKNGKFSSMTVKDGFPFSPYAIFTTCDGALCTTQQKGDDNALSEHSILNGIHLVLKNIFVQETLTHPNEYHQLAVRQEIQNQADWVDAKFFYEDDNYIKPMLRTKLWIIESVLTDVAIALYLVIGRAVTDEIVDDDNIISTKIENFEDFARTVDSTSGPKFLFVRTVIKTILEKVGKKCFEAQDAYTHIGQSIVNHILHGMVYIGSLNTTMLMKTSAHERFKNLGQINALTNYFCKPSNQSMDVNMSYEMIYINPKVEGAKNFVPMNSAAMLDILQREENARKDGS